MRSYNERSRHLCKVMRGGLAECIPDRLVYPPYGSINL